MNLHLPVLAFLAHGVATAPVPDCTIGDAARLETMPVLNCAFTDAESVESCRKMLAWLTEQSDAGWRDATRMLALAYGSRSQRVNVDGETSQRDRERSVALYRTLVESDPTDAEAILGLSSTAESQAERVALLRRYVALRPENVLGRRLLAHALFYEGTGSPDAMLEAGRLMEEAYAWQPDSHRWWLAGTAMFYYTEAGEPTRAAELRARVTGELPVHDLTNASIAADWALAGRVLSTVCDPYLIEAVGSARCVLNLDQVESFLAKAAHDERSQRVADLSADAMVGLARAESALCPDLVGRLDRFAARGFDSAAIQRSREQVRQLEGTITVE